MAVVLDQIDLVDHANFSDGVPLEWFAHLREHAPVYLHPAPADGTLPEFWCLTRHADIAAASRDTTRFKSGAGVSLLQIQAFDDSLSAIASDFLLLTDPPAHTSMRRLISSAFTPKAIAQMEEDTRRLASDAIDAMLLKGECDFVEPAASLPIQVIASMMGVPEPDRPRLYDWTTRTFGVEDPECSASSDDFIAAFGETFMYALELCGEKRSNPTDDILSTLVHAEIDGERLSDNQLSLFFYLLASAGNETTRTLMMQGMLELLARPEVEADLRRDRALLPGAVEEMLRYSTPVHHMARTATTDIELRGETIREGDLVALWYVSGNRDEEVFERPNEFDIRRDGTVLHQAFGGGGAHHCLGASLARMEARVFFEELFERVDDIEQAGPALRLRSNFTNGLKSLPVRYRARS